MADRRTPRGWAFSDAGSTNGSRVNGWRVTSAELRPGDVVELGHAQLLVSP